MGGVARYYFLEEIPIQTVRWPKLPQVFDGTLRKPMADFQEGCIVTGTSHSIHLHHGICIDFGCNLLGLLPMNATIWERIYAELPLERHAELRPDFDKLQPDKPLTNFSCKVRRKLD